jgi:hypothetical protein
MLIVCYCIFIVNYAILPNISNRLEDNTTGKNKIFPSFLAARKARYAIPEELKNLAENGPSFWVIMRFQVLCYQFHDV